LSFNYFANSQVYDPRADYIAYVGSDTTTKDSKYGLKLGISAISNTITVSSEPMVDPASSSDVNQIATANNSNNSVQGKSDKDRVSLINLSASTMSFSGGTQIEFDLTRKDSTDSGSLSKQYDVSVSITDANTPSIKYVIKLPTPYGSLPTQSYTFNFNDMTPICTGLTPSNSYYLTVGLTASDNQGFTFPTLITPESTIASNITPTVTNTANDVIGCLSVTGLIYTSDNLEVDMQFTPKVNITDFILSSSVTGSILLKTDSNPTPLVIGKISLSQNDINTVEFDTYTIENDKFFASDNLLVWSKGTTPNSNCVSRDKITFDLSIGDNTVNFINSTSSPIYFNIKWSTGAVFNNNFPH